MAAFNFHRRQTRRWWYAGVTLIAAAFFTVFFVVGASATGIGALSGSPSNFESGDGNMVLNTSGNTDWNCFQGSGGFQATANYGTDSGGNAFAKSDCKVTTGATQTWADGGTTSVGTTETQIVSGTKFDTMCPPTNTGGNPPKDEFTNVAEYSDFDASGNLFFYGAVIRPTTNGNTSGNVILAQNATATSIGCRTAGDVLIAFDFLNGGGTPSLHTLTWITSGSCYVSHDSAPCWGKENTVPAADFNGNVNTSTILAGDNGISGTQLNANAFSEFGINLTQALINAGITTPDTCFAAEAWESRSSGSSFTSNPEDLELSGHATCGSIEIIKHTDPSGIDQNFGFGTTGPSGSAMDGASFTLNDNSSNSGGFPNSKTYGDLTPGTYSVTETEAANFAPEATTCTDNGTTDNSVVSADNLTVTINLAQQGNWVCTYTNKRQLGAIKITKESSKAAATPLAGATFSIKNSSGTVVATPTSGSDGTVCVGSLPFDDYTVTETAAPSGYSIDTTSKDANITSAGDCTSSGTPSVSLTFTDTPKTDLTVEAKSQVSGGTKSTITCGVDPSNTGTGTGGSLAEDSKLTATGLAPGTYDCKIVIDP
jgi:Prealbumin-like fold domain